MHTVAPRRENQVTASESDVVFLCRCVCVCVCVCARALACVHKHEQHGAGWQTIAAGLGHINFEISNSYHDPVKLLFGVFFLVFFLVLLVSVRAVRLLRRALFFLAALSPSPEVSNM